MVASFSWYGRLGSSNYPTSQLQADLRTVSVAPGPLPGTGGCHSGQFMTTSCGQVRGDGYLGTMSPGDAHRATRFSAPFLKYNDNHSSQSSFVSDLQKSRNYTQVPEPRSQLSHVYDHHGMENDGLYHQDTVLIKKPYMPREYVHAEPGVPLTLSEAQMVQPMIDHRFGFHDIPPSDLGIGGGFYTVNRITRQVEKKNYWMGPSQGYPTHADAKWAADNLVTPRSTLAVKSL